MLNVARSGCGAVALSTLQRSFGRRSRRSDLATATSVTAAVMMALYGVPVAADDEALQEIIVTATRHAASAQDIPISITAVTGTSLDQAGIQDIAHLAQSIAGVNVADKGPFSGTSASMVIIRGLNSDPNNGSAEPGVATPIIPPVATYVDDTPLFFNLRLQDLDHVEILRGPQGTLYGSGSLGGTIRFVQNAPDPSAFDAKVEAGLSDTDRTHAVNDNISGMLNLPVSPTFAVRMNASFTDQAGFINMPNLYVLDSSGAPVAAHPGQLLSPPLTYSQNGVNSYGYRTARIAMLFKPNDDFHAQLNYYYQRSTADGFPSTMPKIYGTTSLTSGDYIPAVITDRVNLVALTLDYDLGFATITSNSSWSHHDNDAESDSTTIYVNFPFYSSLYGSNPRALVVSRDQLDDKPWSEEIRLASKSGGAFDWVAGLFYKNEQTDIQQHDFYPGYNDYFNACVPVYGVSNGDGVTPSQCGIGEYGPQNNVTEIDGIPLVKDQAYVGDFQTHFTDVAAFGELTWHPTNAWSLTGGTRVFKQTVSQAQQDGLLFDGPAYITNQSLSDEWRRALWKLNAAYKINSSNLLYATWSQGFRRGGVNALPTAELAVGYVTNPGLFKVQPDKADNYEIGAKGTVQNRLRYATAIYDIQWHDIQESAALTPLALPGVLNVGDGYSRGIELELSASITQHLAANLSYTYDETKLTSFSSLAAIGLTVPPPAVGSPLPGTPKNSLEVGLEYGHVKLAGGELRYAISGHYQSSLVPALSATVPTVGGYTVMATQASFTRANWRATLYVENLTNVLGVSSYSDPYYFQNRYAALVSQPRTIGFTVGYSFKPW
jgi:iron complex outermembrane recepter protein